jgi:hypothetical protein
MIENLIRTALSTTLAATEVVLSKTLETVRFLNDALEPGEDVRVADTPVKAAPSAPAKQPSWRPPELGDLEATAQALTARSTRPVGTRPPRAAMRRKTTTADPAPAEATPSPRTKSSPTKSSPTKAARKRTTATTTSAKKTTPRGSRTPKKAAE